MRPGVRHRFPGVTCAYRLLETYPLQEVRNAVRDPVRRLLPPLRVGQLRGVLRVTHVAALDEHLRNRGEVEAAEIAADVQPGAVADVVGGLAAGGAHEFPAHRVRRARREGATIFAVSAAPSVTRAGRMTWKPRFPAPEPSAWTETTASACALFPIRARSSTHGPNGAVAVLGELHRRALRFEEGAGAAGDIEGELRLGVTGVGGRARGVALLAVGADVHVRGRSRPCDRELSGLWPGSITTTLPVRGLSSPLFLGEAEGEADGDCGGCAGSGEEVDETVGREEAGAPPPLSSCRPRLSHSSQPPRPRGARVASTRARVPPRRRPGAEKKLPLDTSAMVAAVGQGASCRSGRCFPPGGARRRPDRPTRSRRPPRAGRCCCPKRSSRRQGSRLSRQAGRSRRRPLRAAEHRS